MADTPPAPTAETPRNIYVFGATSFLNDTASEMAYWVLPAFLASIGAGPAQLGIIEGIGESRWWSRGILWPTRSSRCSRWLLPGGRFWEFVLPIAFPRASAARRAT